MSTDFEIPIVYNELNQPDGSIKVSLKPHATDTSKYSITSVDAEKTATAIINNNDLPDIAVAVHSDSAGGVTEAANAMAKFTITSTDTISTGSSVTVSYTITETQSFLPTSQATTGTVTFRSAVLSNDVAIAIESDETNERNGKITLTLTADSNTPKRFLVPAANQSKFVNVIDDDKPVDFNCGTYRFEIHYIIESSGGSARFTISSTYAPYEDLAIEFAVTEQTEFYLSPNNLYDRKRGIAC